MQDSHSPDSPAPEESLSAQFDGELRDDFSRADRGIAPETESRLRSDWSAVRSALKSLPRASVDLVSAVRSGIAATAEPSRTSRPVGVRPWLAVVASTAAVLFLLLLPRLSRDSESGDVAMQAMAMKSVRSQADPVTWDVVVLTVDHDNDLRTAMRGVIGNAHERGVAVMPVRKSIDSRAEFSAGVLLTAGEAPQSVLASLMQEESAEWNPLQIGEHSREELKQKFLASMKVPSRSDAVFGAMFVVGEDGLAVSELAFQDRLPLRTAQSTESEALAVAAGEMDSATADSKSVTFDGLSEPSAKASAQPASRAATTSPVLVIIRKRVAHVPERPSADEPHGYNNVPVDGRLPA